MKFSEQNCILRESYFQSTPNPTTNEENQYDFILFCPDFTMKLFLKVLYFFN